MLLASETKDFRLLAHLLRTLQHAGDILLASRMLAIYRALLDMRRTAEHGPQKTLCRPGDKTL